MAVAAAAASCRCRPKMVLLFVMEPIYITLLRWIALRKTSVLVTGITACDLSLGECSCSVLCARAERLLLILFLMAPLGSRKAQPIFEQNKITKTKVEKPSDQTQTRKWNTMCGHPG